MRISINEAVSSSVEKKLRDIDLLKEGYEKSIFEELDCLDDKDLDESKAKPKFYDSMFGEKVRKAYDSGNLTYDNISDWETEFNGGIRPNPPLNTRQILDYYRQNKKSISESKLTEGTIYDKLVSAGIIKGDMKEDYSTDMYTDGEEFIDEGPYTIEIKDIDSLNGEGKEIDIFNANGELACKDSIYYDHDICRDGSTVTNGLPTLKDYIDREYVAVYDIENPLVEDDNIMELDEATDSKIEYVDGQPFVEFDF